MPAGLELVGGEVAAVAAGQPAPGSAQRDAERRAVAPTRDLEAGWTAVRGQRRDLVPFSPRALPARHALVVARGLDTLLPRQRSLRPAEQQVARQPAGRIRSAIACATPAAGCAPWSGGERKAQRFQRCDRVFAGGSRLARASAARDQAILFDPDLGAIGRCAVSPYARLEHSSAGCETEKLHAAQQRLAASAGGDSLPRPRLEVGRDHQRMGREPRRARTVCFRSGAWQGAGSPLPSFSVEQTTSLPHRGSWINRRHRLHHSG